MALDSTAIWDALYDRVVAAAGGSFTRVSRKRREWGIEEHPVLMVLDDSSDEVLISDRYDPSPTWRITGEIILLLRNNDLEVTEGATSPRANDLKRQVMEALERKPTDEAGHATSHYTDLGGMIAGLSVTRVEKGNGEKAGQAVVRISLELETNPP